MENVELKSKNKYFALALYDIEFHKNGISYLDTFFIKRSIFFGEIIDTITQEAKDKRIQFCKSFQGSWN